MRHVVELHLLLVVAQQEGPGAEGGGFGVDEGLLDNLRVAAAVLGGALVLPGVREGVRIDALSEGGVLPCCAHSRSAGAADRPPGTRGQCCGTTRCG